MQGQYVGTLSLEYSLERSNRIFACPLESVSLTCSINGTWLVWDVWEYKTSKVRRVLCRPDDRPGEGFSFREHFDCHGDMLFSGVLDERSPEVNNATVSVCNSSMIIRPFSRNASSDCDPLTIICKPSDQGPEATKNVTYQVAGESDLTLYI